MSINIKIFDIIESISGVLGLADNNITKHHRKVTYISLKIGKELDFSEDELYNLVLAASIHNLGALSFYDYNFSDGIIKENHHEEKGYLIVKNFKTMEEIARIIRYHHFRWDYGNKEGYDNEEIPFSSFIISLANVIVELSNEFDWEFNSRQKIKEIINNKSGSHLPPKIVEVFNKLSKKDAFWLDIEFKSDFSDIKNEFYRQRYLKNDDLLIDFSRSISYIIDFRNKYTVGHSYTVSNIAAKLASYYNFNDTKIKKIKAAGLLHDIGKLAVPGSVLRKSEELTYEEYLKMKAHPYFTRKILSNIDGFYDISKWASFHHEALDGKGYPYQLNESELSLESRIMAVSELFVSLSEKRAYRDKLNKKGIINIMRSMVTNHKIDGHVFKKIYDNYDEFKEIIKQSYLEEKFIYDEYIEKITEFINKK